MLKRYATSVTTIHKTDQPLQSVSMQKKKRHKEEILMKKLIKNKPKEIELINYRRKT